MQLAEAKYAAETLISSTNEILTNVNVSQSRGSQKYRHKTTRLENTQT